MNCISTTGKILNKKIKKKNYLRENAANSSKVVICNKISKITVKLINEVLIMFDKWYFYNNIDDDDAKLLFF